MATNDIDRRLNLIAGEQSALKSVEQMNRFLDKAKKNAAETGRAFTSGFKNSGKAIADTTNELKALESEARRASKALDEASKKRFGREQIGDVSTTLSGAASLAGAAGGGAGIEALRIGSDLTGVLEYAGKFKDAVNDAGKAAQNAGGLIGGLANAGAGVAGVLPGVSAGFGAVAAVAAPLALAAAGLAVAFTHLQEQARIATEATDFYLSKRNAASEAEKTLTTDEAQKRLDEARAREAELNQIIKDGATIRQQTFDEASKQSGDLFARVSTAAAEASGVFTKFDEDVTKAKSELSATRGEIAGLEKALEGGKTAANDAKVATEDNTKAEEQLKAQRQQHQATIAALDEQERSLNETYKERSKLTGQNRFKDDLRGAIDEAIARKRANEDLQRALEEQAAAHEKNLLDITKRGQEQIADVLKSVAEKEAQAFKQIADLQNQFAKDELKAIQEFTKQRKRIEEDFRRSEARAKEDFTKSQNKAILDNSVLAFLENKDAFKTNKRRGREDFRTDRDRATEDFTAEREAAAQALQERILGIQTELAEFKAASALKILQIQQQTAQELALAQQAYDEKLAKDAELRAIQNQRDIEDAAVKQERLSADRAIEDARALDAHNAALTKIDEKRTAEETALGAVDVAIQTVRGNEMALINTISGGLSTLQAKAYAFYQAASGRSSSSSSSRGKLPGYAAGTPYLPQDTIAQVHKGEAIIPAARNPNNPGGRGMAINFSPQFKTVDMGGKQYALVSDVQAGFENLIQAVEHTIAIQFGN